MFVSLLPSPAEQIQSDSNFNREQMEIKRTIEIFIETERRSIVCQSERGEQTFCPGCGEMMLTSEQAAAALETNCRTVFRMVESGSIHFSETKTGSVMICLPSLATGLQCEAKRIGDAECTP
ncbi:MAG TPA: hypothetical protein VF596_08535 [Pyrinomonadaceae bacterium]|jgi:hypothetical protein